MTIQVAPPLSERLRKPFTPLWIRLLVGAISALMGFSLATHFAYQWWPPAARAMNSIPAPGVNLPGNLNIGLVGVTGAGGLTFYVDVDGEVMRDGEAVCIKRYIPEGGIRGKCDDEPPVDPVIAAQVSKIGQAARAQAR
jgi:hypothetical protein